MDRQASPVFAASAIFVLVTSLAYAHVHKEEGRAPIDWYPTECCRDGDCQPATYIGMTAAGIWLGSPDGVTVLVGPRDVRKPSKDDRWHICVAPDETDTPALRCVFEPVGS